MLRTRTRSFRGSVSFYDREVFTVSFALGDNQKVLLTAQALDAKGNPVPDAVTWSTSDPSIVALANPTDTTIEAIAGVVGSAVVSAQDALGLAATFAVDVTAGPAVTLEITAGTPEAQ